MGAVTLPPELTSRVPVPSASTCRNAVLTSRASAPLD